MTLFLLFLLWMVLFTAVWRRMNRSAACGSLARWISQIAETVTVHVENVGSEFLMTLANNLPLRWKHDGRVMEAP